MILSKIENKEGILQSIKDFLGKGSDEMTSDYGSSALTSELLKVRDEIRGYAEDYGLDPFEIIFEMVDHDQINSLAALGGFPVRYPHWRFGMEYDQLSKGYYLGTSKNLRDGDQHRSLRTPI